MTELLIDGYGPLAADIVPASLKSLTFLDESLFNQPLAPGSVSLESLTLGEAFEEPLAAGVLPASLQELYFGAEFIARSMRCAVAI